MKRFLRIARRIAATGLGATGLSAQTTATEETALDQAIEAVSDLERLQQGLEENSVLQPGITQDYVPTIKADTSTKISFTPNPRDTSSAAATAEWNNRNWLIAGMQALEGTGDGGTAGAAAESDGATVPGSAEPWLNLGDDRLSESKMTAPTDRTNAELDRESAAAPEFVAPNPLDDFMADWLTVDALDQFGSGNEPAGLEGRGAAEVSWDLSTASDTTLPSMTSWGRPVSVGNVSRPDVQSNPYLEGLEGAATAEGASAGFSGTTGTQLDPMESLERFTPQPRSETASEEPVDVKSNTTWKPPVKDDEKYFPRLQRF